MTLWTSSPENLLEAMKAAKLWRAWLVTDPQRGGMRASHPLFDEICQKISLDDRDYHGHSAILLEIGRESGHLLSAAIHKTRRGQAAGGVRFWRYDTLEGFFRDGLRLSRGMGHKNALAGLWWGGGKGVIARRPGHDHRDPSLRAKVYRDYGRFMSGIRGCYVTAEDAGTVAEDMATIFGETRHTTCIPARVGGSGNPSELTARGVVVAMEAALEWRGLGTLEGKRIATQGVGNVARFMIGELLERGVREIVGSDVDPVAIELTQAQFPDAPLHLELVGFGDNGLLSTPCDVLAPNAVGGTLNADTIPSIQAEIVCGAANNQLHEHDRDAREMAARGILYVPDFLANRMGIVNCANEQYGRLSVDPFIEKHLDRGTSWGIFKRSHEVYGRAEASGRTPAEEAIDLAEELSEELHPIWGDRSQLILNDLVESGWASEAG